jgi:hypothetical protein
VEGSVNTYLIRGLLICGLSLLVAGCAHYYRVTDPGSGKTYYTNDLTEGRGGAVKFRDERARSTVTLQSSEVTEISPDEYEAEVRGMSPIVMPPPMASHPPVATEPSPQIEP